MVDVLTVPLGVAGIATGIYRAVRRHRYAYPYLGVLATALGVGLLVRSPSFGDYWLDSTLLAVTGVANLPDLTGHIATFTAMAAAIAFFSRSMGFTRSLRSLYAALALFCIACVSLFVQGVAPDIQTENMVQLPGMEAYSIMFSVALLVTHMFGFAVVRASVSEDGWGMAQTLLMVGVVGGVLMALHRIAVIIVPALEDVAYSPITWITSLTCLAGYIASAAWLTYEQCPARTGRPTASTTHVPHQ